MDEHAFPLTAFAVAWLGCSLQYIKNVLLNTCVSNYVPLDKISVYVHICLGYRKSAMTEDQLKKKQQRDNKRKQMAQEKREKDKVHIEQSENMRLCVRKPTILVLIRSNTKLAYAMQSKKMVRGWTFWI